MPRKGPYKLYYDKNFASKVPRSTISDWKKKIRRKSNEPCQNVFHVTDLSDNSNVRYFINIDFFVLKY